MAYQYEPLEAGEIRLLILEPAGSATVTCSLRYVSLDDNPRYIRQCHISGETLRLSVTPIACSRKEVKVTLNLEMALRHLRYAVGDKQRVLWADAICINQQDLEERSQQVLLMAKIFKHAEQAFIWLGEETEHVKDSFWSIHATSLFIRVQVPDEEATNLTPSNARNMILKHNLKLKWQGKPNSFSYNWGPYVSLLQRP
jgi:hypothetical protein